VSPKVYIGKKIQICGSCLATRTESIQSLCTEVLQTRVYGAKKKKKKKGKKKLKMEKEKKRKREKMGEKIWDDTEVIKKKKK
jgi:hypothetical protein